jgi:hypothetical protein
MHASPFVHALPLLQPVPSGAAELVAQAPLTGSHAGTRWHWSVAVQPHEAQEPEPDEDA